ncbi:hypothetical protein SSABA_v1c03660 [Spiroplasma sabaudiense Ar-1343]|uniref:Uncharacterized protein n=1 Tax=Spiroplasma sabaudiense Ar-1343 TaxID=1276257 RepID=W6AAB2_9MOLU|nr:hypothetical protein [Spiroplasma sabaudiense]AHI53775.1 hypothetical protein SSABA_v1c03660 [Spiroplasma sabaudiense Ar-1343]
MFKISSIILSSFIVAPNLEISTNVININKISINQNEINDNVIAKSEFGKLIGTKASPDEIEKFSYKVPNYEWFTKLESKRSFGYTSKRELTKGSSMGLCEYISLSTIMTYLELFVSPSVFSEKAFEHYFQYDDDYSGDLILAPYHINYQNLNPDSSLPVKLWKLNKKKTDLKGGSFVHDTFRAWNKLLDLPWKIDDEYSAAWWHTSNPEDWLIKYDVPVMLSWVKNAHNIIIYGYDKPTNRYLVHYGWDYESARIINKADIWRTFSMGFWNAFYPTPGITKGELKPLFKYKGQKYNWHQLQNMGFNADDIKSM